MFTVKRAQVKVEVQVKIERSIETEPTGGAQGGVALAAAGGSGFVCFLCQDSMPAPDIGDGLDLSDPDHPNHNSLEFTGGPPFVASTENPRAGSLR